MTDVVATLLTEDILSRLKGIPACLSYDSKHDLQDLGISEKWPPTWAAMGNQYLSLSIPQNAQAEKPSPSVQPGNSVAGVSRKAHMSHLQGHVAIYIVGMVLIGALNFRTRGCEDKG
ncbi:hypothetical protein BKA56DRAFT_662319 [Ilyonectria sp. MPI-CAGE-AT-0026]|nr:hypothetical protein BKA56DRAFT_662319 [Ilyonectria sp. MPI-CAGE-AT-0026]